jgi:nicotinate-nucleotide--dimethylbenzimidazole phosphoribosyltransferase
MSAEGTAIRRAADAVAAIGPPDPRAMAEARALLDALTKPPGSLGRLEALAIRLAGITGMARPTFARRAIVVMAADHGIARQGVSAYPAEVTAQMVANYAAGGAAINALASLVAASVTVVDVGVATPIPSRVVTGAGAAALVRAPIRSGTDDLTTGPAMSRSEAERAIVTGLEVGASLRRDGVGLLGVGEMGIGNTTAASAITAAMTGLPVDRVTGRGTGIDDATWARKVDVVARALDRHRPDAGDPIGVLAAVGGFEIGALVGLVLAAAEARIPVILDGFITAAAALLATAVAPSVGQRLIAGHRSAEPGHAIALDRLGLEPLLELDLRLGEGTGAALAMSLVDATLAIRDGMATFEGAGVAGPLTPASR